MYAIECSNLNKQVGNFRFHDVAFALEPGYILGVIGVNGAGKSTLLKCLMDESVIPSVTDVRIYGESIKENPMGTKKRMAFVLNECPFPMGLSGREQVNLFSPLYEKFSTERFFHWMAHFQVNERTPLRKLSKGQLMKFQLAFALSYDADLYFLDEPSANLDVGFREEFYQIVRDLISDGTKSVMYVTQLVEELDGLADYILWLDHGKQLLYTDIETMRERFQIVSGLERSISCIPYNLTVGKKYSANHNEALIDCWQGELMLPLKKRSAGIDEIMCYFAENPSRMKPLLLDTKEKAKSASGYRYGGGIYV